MSQKIDDKVAVIGSRGFNSYALLKTILDSEKPGSICSGGASGADSLARRYAVEKGLELKEFLPEYDKYGRGAPLIRNKQIVDHSDRVIAFWDGISRGTKNAIDYAESQGKSVQIINISKELNRSSIIGEPQDRKNAWDQYLDSKRSEKSMGSSLKDFKAEAKGIEDIVKRRIFKESVTDLFYEKNKYGALTGKDNVFITIPTSGNQFPSVLANRLQKDFGGTVIENAGTQVHNSEMKKLVGYRKIFEEREYVLHNEFKKTADSLKGKNIVIVDDLISTGSTIDSFRAELNKIGIKSGNVCSLINSSSALVTSNNIDKIAEKLKVPDTEITEYREKLQTIFHNAPGGVAYHLLKRSSISKDDVAEDIRNLIDKKYSAYTRQLYNEYTPEKGVASGVMLYAKEKHSIALPASIADTIETAVRNKTKPQDLQNAISDAVNQIKSNDYKWSERGLPHNVVTAYVSDMKNTDMYYVKSERNSFTAYKVSDGSHSRLGTDASLDSIKTRVEQYAVVNNIKSSIDKTIHHSKPIQMGLDI